MEAPTQEQLQHLEDYNQGIDRPSPLARAGIGLVNIIPNTLGATVGVAQNVFDSPQSPRVSIPTIPLPEAVSPVEKGIDFGTGAADAIANFAAAEAVTGGLGELLSPMVKKSVSMALGNAAVAAQSDPSLGNVGLAALQGAVLAPTTGLPATKRLAYGAGVGLLGTSITGDINQIPNTMMLNLFGGHGETKEKPVAPGSKPIENLDPLSASYLRADEGIIPTNVQPNEVLLKQQALAAGAQQIAEIGQPKPVVLPPEQGLIPVEPAAPKRSMTFKPGDNSDINAQLSQVLKGIGGDSEVAPLQTEPVKLNETARQQSLLDQVNQQALAGEPKPVVLPKEQLPVEQKPLAEKPIKLRPVTEPLPTTELAKVATLQDSLQTQSPAQPVLSDAGYEAWKAKREAEGYIENSKALYDNPRYSKIEGESPRTQKAQDIHDLVQDKIKNWKNAPEVSVEQSAPASAPDAAGKYENGKVTLYADNIKDKGHAIETLMHEVVGHHGIEGILGDQYGTAMDRAGHNIAPNRLQELAKAYSTKESPIDLNNVHHRRLMIEEYMARQAAKNSLPSKVYSAVKDGLNKLGFQFKDDFIRQLIKSSRRYVRDGNTETFATLQKGGQPPLVVKKLGHGRTTPEEARFAQLVHELDTKVGSGWQGMKLSEVRPEMQDVWQEAMELMPKIRRDSTLPGYSWLGTKEESKMPGYVELLIKHPTEGPDSPHWPGEHGVVGSVRGYEETLPSGEKAFHVIEIQSDWGQDTNKLRSSQVVKVPGTKSWMVAGKDGRISRDLFTSKAEAEKWKQTALASEDSPHLNNYETLGLKAAIAHAKEIGATKLIVSDAETAMMTEMHDKASLMVAPTEHNARLAERLSNLDEGVGFLPEEIQELREGTGHRIEGLEPEDIQAYKDAGYQLVTSPIAQEKGMRLHYDETIPSAARKLTGDAGQPIELGIHQQTIKGEHLEGSPVFTQGEAKLPKTNITGTVYDLAQAHKTFTENGGFSTGDARYSKPLPSDEQKTQLIATLQKFAPAAVGATAGAIWSATSEGKVSMAQGILGGALFGAYGPKVVTHLFGENPGSLLSDVSKRVGQAVEKTRTETGTHPWEAIKSMFEKGSLRRLGEEGAILEKRDGVSMAVRWMEQQLHINVPDEIRDALLKAEGEGSLIARTISAALEKAGSLDVDLKWKAISEKFNSNQISEAELRGALGTSAHGQLYADYLATARNGVNAYQQMFFDSLPEGKFKNIVGASIKRGDYMTMAYEAFTKPEFKVDRSLIPAAQADLMKKFPELAGDVSSQDLTVYFDDIARSKGMYRGSLSDQGQKIDSIIFKGKKELPGSFKALLGEIKDPDQRMLLTLRKLYPNAVAAKFTNLLDLAKDAKGNLIAMTDEVLSHEIEALKGKVDPDSLEKLATLQAYLPLDMSPRYGALAGKRVSRFVSDQLSTHETIFDDHGNAIMNGLNQFQSAVKQQHTSLNPFMHIQNIFGAPVLGYIGRANVKGYCKAIEMIKQGASHPDFAEAVKNGVMDANFATGELQRDIGRVFQPQSTNPATATIEKIMRKAQQLHALPDILSRAASYFAARERFAEKMNLPETAKEVIDAARKHTDRYCPNFAMVSPLIKTLRKTPFVNMYITYAAELSRICKNMVMDVVSKDTPIDQRVHSAKALGGMIALPLLAEKVSVAALSPKDQQDWEQAMRLSPDYARNATQIVTGRNKDGSFNIIKINRSNQMDMLTQPMRAAVNGDWKSFAAINPLAGLDNTVWMSIGASQISGMDIHTKQPLTGITSRVQQIMRESLSPIFPGSSEANKWANAFTPNNEGGLGISNPVSGQSNTPSQMIATYLSGLKFQSIQPAHLIRQVVGQAQREMADQTKFYDDRMSSNLPKDQVKAAAETKAMVQQRILKDLADRLGATSK